MNNTIEKYFIDYVELGKIYTDHDSTDFYTLDYSRDEVLVKAGERCRYFVSNGLKYPDPPDKTPFSKITPNLSCCFLRVRNPQITKEEVYYYLFVQIQRRGEGDYSKRLGNSPRVNRSFNHLRFVQLESSYKDFFSADMLESYLSKGYRVFSELLYVNKEGSLSMGEDLNALRDYLPNSSGSVVDTFFDPSRLSRVDWLNESSIVKGLVNLLSANFRETGKYFVQIVDQGYSWKEKLALIEAANVLLWPISGLLSFSLDYISERDNIGVQFFHAPHLDKKYPRKSIADYIQSHTTFDELVQLRNKYSKHFENTDFIQNLRVLVLNGARILNSANMAAVICDLPEGEAQDVLQDSANVHALIRSGLLLSFLRKFRKQTETQEYLDAIQLVLSQYSDVIANSFLLEILGFIFDEKVTDTKMLLFVPFINRHKQIWLDDQEMFMKLEAFLDSFSSLLTISKELETVIVSKVFSSLSRNLESKQKLPSSEIISWLTLYSELNAGDRKRYADIIAFILHNNVELVEIFLKGNPGLRVDFYRNVIRYLLNEDILFESSLMRDWSPGKNVDFDEVVGAMTLAGEIELVDFIDYALESIGVERLRWILKIIKTDYAFRKTAEKVTSIVGKIKTERVEDFVKKFELCLTNIKSLEGMDEKIELVEALRERFAYNIFPVSDYTERWFFEKIRSADETEILRIISTLRQHARLEEGLEINKKLDLYCSPKPQFSALLKRYLKKEIPQKLFYVLIFMSNDRELSDMVLILLDNLNREKECNNVLYEFVRRRKLVKLENKMISQWLEMTRRDSLRVKYMEGSHDLLRDYISRLPNGSDERLYEAYISDPLKLDFQLFWRDYVEKLPKNKKNGTRYSIVLEVIQHVGLSVDVSIKGNELLRQCAQIADLQIKYGANPERLVYELQGYLNSESLVVQLEQYIKSVIDKNQKRDDGLLPRWGSSWGGNTKPELPAPDDSIQQIDLVTPIILLVILCLILAAVPMVYGRLSMNMTDLASIALLFALGLLVIVLLGILVWYFFGGLRR